MNKLQQLMDYTLAHKDIYIEELDERYSDPETFLVLNFMRIMAVHQNERNLKILLTISSMYRESGALKHIVQTSTVATMYMLANTDQFIKDVFKDDPRYAAACMGMISAHGDKVEQYMGYWRRAGLLTTKAQIIYFLTYTKLLGDTPKSKSAQWVVDNYNTYAHLLP